MRVLSVLIAFLCVCGCVSLRAGVARVNATLPTGVPLAGFNHGARRAPEWPLPNNTKYTTFMSPSQGHLDPTYIRCLALDDGTQTYFFLTVDAIGADGTIRQLSVTKAQALGVNATRDNVLLHASHTHSGPGAVSPDFVWQMAPATDLLVPQLLNMITDSAAQAMKQAQDAMQPAKIAIGDDILTNVTVNRRARISPYVNSYTIDPHLTVMRVDDMNGKPMATVWNYAMHGTCFGPDQMLSNSDIMGGINNIIEEQMDLGIAMFINADAGDIDPSPSSCANKPQFDGAPVVASAVQKLRNQLNVTDDVIMKGFSQVVDFGGANINYTLERFANCSSGGPLDICTLCKILGCDVITELGTAWLEGLPRFTAISFDIASSKTLMVTIPGEPLLELGWQIRNDSQSLGFDRTLLAGYSMNHMGYFATPDEYQIGGYESQLTFWGIDTAEKVRAACKDTATKINQ